MERLAQKLGITVVNSECAVNALFAVLAELFDTWPRDFTYEGSRNTHFVIPTSMTISRLTKQHLANVGVPHMGE